MTNVLVTGSNGQLGSLISENSVNHSEYNFIFCDKSNLDITNHSLVRQFILKYNINIIINCAAYTNVEKAESEKNIANKINHLAVANLAKLSKKYSVSLIHISTDYVFDGNNIIPYLETDIPNPKSVYGLTKLKGERAIQSINPKNSIIIRTSWLYSKLGNNFLNKMIELAKIKNEISVVSDLTGSPTNSYDLANVILSILSKIKNVNVEVFHFSNEGACSWYDFANMIFQLKKIKIKVNPINSIDFISIAERPKYSVLNTNKISKYFDVEIHCWKESLTRSLNE